MVGRRIVDVEQAQIHGQGGRVTAIDALVLDDGTRILFFAHDDPSLDQPYVTAEVAT